MNSNVSAYPMQPFPAQGGAVQSHSSGNVESSHIVEFQNVSKAYEGERHVVHELNLQIRRGEFLTLLGPSGSGKTTCLMMLAGFEQPTEGEILLSGTPVTHLPAHRRGIGVVFQNYALFPHMTVAENVSFPLDVRRVPKSDRQARVDRALAMVEMTGLGYRKPAQLSGGQQQRVALARALVFEPGIILLDEPLGALDKRLRESMQIELKHLHRRLGVTMVYVTHDQSEALTMSDRVAVFSQGQIQQIGPPEYLYEEPANAFVATFVGDNNALPCTVLETGYGKSIVEVDGSTWSGRPIGPIQPGQQGLICVRPERMLVGKAGDELPNGMQLSVEDILFLGDQRTVLARSSSGLRLSAKLRAEHIAPIPGEQIWMGFDPQHGRVFADV